VPNEPLEPQGFEGFFVFLAGNQNGKFVVRLVTENNGSVVQVWYSSELAVHIF